MTLMTRKTRRATSRQASTLVMAIAVDNFLNQNEMSALSNKTSASAEEGTMGDDEWQMLCQLLGADHKVGLRWTDLILVYTKLADSLGANLARDFEICFPNTALAQR